MTKTILAQPRSRVRLSLPELLCGVKHVAEFCAQNAPQIDHCGALPVEEFDLIAKAGLLIAPLKLEFGGLGLGIDSSTLSVLLPILKQIGRSNLAIGRIYEGHVNAVQLVQTFGTAEQVAAFAADVRDRQKIFGVWNAEANDGVKLFPSEQTCRIEGSKTFCSGTGLVDRPFVNGVLPDGGWQMAIVPMEEVATVSDPSWWQPLGMRATASFKVDFSGVELDVSSLIGQAGDYFRQPWLSAGVVRFAAVQLGGAEALFDATRSYLQELGRTQDPYQSERLGKMAIAIESGNLWLQGAVDRIAAYHPIFGGDPTEAQPDADRLVAYTNMVRTAIEQICMDVIQLCERSVGTRGLMPPYSMERIVRDLTLYLRQPVFDLALANVGQFSLKECCSVDSLWDCKP